ncbi:cap-specific mRNA (nucleoside-2'-O-)-methyltransferase 2-like isoform X2 [Daktulosphaira vitifoliae]|uniref:cap-specific mRNA (nucleoside-2'-O-)-methyltransferase 2-like isoform X2 n=1 Tax=Daktulosphaira vitifoliae TaxID=58002 RepID=UPI0021AA16C4|nr:cap-specific mRNA (nucleoside-2'-O-)-methyltransferase 2-like isoform X2 [Daktulosphaira vitifoliae]
MASNIIHFEKDIEFSKKVVLNTSKKFPDPKFIFSETSWKLDQFQNLKTKLNFVKHKLNDFILEEWHEHTSKMNPSGLVVNHVRKHIHPDFLTQAWCNMCSVHLCEAPGAFISALNHFMALNHQSIKFDWLAMTLNPYHESNGHPDTVSDDRLIFSTIDKWEFGPDYTGDIFQPRYHEHLYETISKKFDNGASLVTADGSIDCSDDPGEQENIVMSLHNYEMMVALNIIQNGGSFVLKMFTIFECNTICRIYLLCCLFQSVEIQKPATSKSGNSEVYVVCKGYMGRSLATPYIQMFFKSKNHDNALLPLSQIPNNFIDELYNCSSYFCDLQIKTIEKNIITWNNKNESYKEINEIQRIICQEYVNRYKLKPIRWDQDVISSSNWSRARNNKRKINISYSEKLRRRDLCLQEEAVLLYQEIVNFSNSKTNECHEILWGRCDQVSLNISNVKYCLGKPVIQVRSSKFCNDSLLQYRIKIINKFPCIDSLSNSESRILYFKTKLNYSKNGINICDLTDTYAKNRNNNVILQYSCLFNILETLQQKSEDFLLIGYPLYTQIAVACFFVIASMFDTFAIIKPDRNFGHAFAFFGFKNLENWLNILSEVLKYILPRNDSYTRSKLALVSWLPIQQLVKQRSHLDIVLLNNLCIAYEVEPILLSFIQS